MLYETENIQICGIDSDSLCGRIEFFYQTGQTDNCHAWFVHVCCRVSDALTEGQDTCLQLVSPNGPPHLPETNYFPAIILRSVTGKVQRWDLSPCCQPLRTPSLYWVLIVTLPLHNICRFFLDDCSSWPPPGPEFGKVPYCEVTNKLLYVKSPWLTLVGISRSLKLLLRILPSVALKLFGYFMRIEVSTDEHLSNLVRMFHSVKCGVRRKNVLVRCSPFK